MPTYEAGRVGVRAVPMTKGFRQDLLADLKEIEKNLRVSIPTELDVSGIKRDAEKIRAAIAKAIGTVEIALAANGKKAVQQAGQTRTAIDGMQADVQVGANSAQAKATAEAIQQELDRLKADVKVSADTAAAQAEAASIQAALDAISAEVPVFVDSKGVSRDVAEILGEVDSLEAVVDVSLDRQKAAREVLRLEAEIERLSADVTVGVDNSKMIRDLSESKARLEAFAGDDVVANVRAAVARADELKAKAQLDQVAHDRDVSIKPKLSMAAMAKVSSQLSAGILSMSKVGVGGAGILTLGSAALAATSQVSALATSLASIAPAALIVPGALAGAAAGIAVLAMSLKDAEAQIPGVLQGFSDLQKSVSSSFWAASAGPINDLATSILPVLKTGLSDVATAFGDWSSAINIAAGSALGLGQMSKMLDYVAQAVDVAAEGVGAFTSGFLTLGLAGSSYLPMLASGFNDIADRFDSWIQGAAQSGQLFDWIDAALVSIQQLGSIVGSVAGIVGGLGKAMNEAAGGGSLGAIADGFRAVNEAVNGPLVQGALVEVFSGANAAMSSIGPALASFGNSLASLAPTLSIIMQQAAGAIGVLVTGLSDVLANPAFQQGLTDMFGGLLTGVQALAPAFGPLGTMLGQIGTLAGQVFSVLGPILGEALTALAPIVGQLATSLGPVVSMLGESLLQAITAVAPMLTQLAAQVFPILAQTLVQLLPPLMQIVIALLPALQPVLSMIGPLIQLLAPILVQIAQTFAQLVAAIAPLVTQLLEGLLPVIMQLAQAVLPPLVDLFMQLVATVLPPILSLFQALVPAIIGIVQAVAPLIAAIVSALIPAFRAILPVVSVVMTSVVSAIKVAIAVVSGIVKVVAGLLTGFVTGMTAIVRFFADLPGKIKSAISGIGDWLRGAGGQLISGMVQGVKDAAAQLWQSVRDAMSGAIDAAKGVLGIASPSKVFAELGVLTGEGMTVGMDSQHAAVAAAGVAMVGAAVPSDPASLIPPASMTTPLTATGPEYLTIRDIDGGLIGRMRVESGKVQSGAVTPLSEGRSTW